MHDFVRDYITAVIAVANLDASLILRIRQFTASATSFVLAEVVLALGCSDRFDRSNSKQQMLLWFTAPLSSNSFGRKFASANLPSSKKRGMRTLILSQERCDAPHLQPYHPPLSQPIIPHLAPTHRGWVVAKNFLIPPVSPT